MVFESKGEIKMGKQVDEMNDLYEYINMVDSNDAILYTLEQIAMSLAVIADKMTEGEKE